MSLLGPAGDATLVILDREDHDLRAAIEGALHRGDPNPGLRIVGSIWRWFQQRGRLREARALLADLLARPSNGDVQIRISGLAAEGGLAYWMNDSPAALAAYEERLTLAKSTGDDILIADAHYDIGFLYMVGGEGGKLREHEQLALDLYAGAGRADAANRARQALVLAVFLAGDYRAAIALEHQNLEGFRLTGSHFQIADSMTLLSAVYWRLGDAATSWSWLTDALRFFSGIDRFESGLARSLGMAAIVLIADGDPELGARVSGAVFALVRAADGILARPGQRPPPSGPRRPRGRAPRQGAQQGPHGGGREMPIDEVVARVLAESAPALNPHGSCPPIYYPPTTPSRD